MGFYSDIQERLATGWNTWNTNSVLSHVLLPEGLAISLGIKNYQTGQVFLNSLIGRLRPDEEDIHPGPRSYDGSYTELTWKNSSLELLVQSTVRGGEQHLLVTPLNLVSPAPVLLVGYHMLWNRPGVICRQGDCMVADLPNRKVLLYADGTEVREMNTGIHGQYIALLLDRPVAVSTGQPVAAREMVHFLAEAKAALEDSIRPYGQCAELAGAIRDCMVWDTIYEPEKEIVCTPVSRLWNINFGGYVLFCWDTYFAAMLAMTGNLDLACANAIAVTREMTEQGFVPNFGAANGYKSRDRSQPPVGSFAVRELYRRCREPRLIREVFDDLLTWNRWWLNNRATPENTLCWGSNPYEPLTGNPWELKSVGKLLGATFESGLDNSPMYDDVPYCDETHLMRLADVGLTGLYILDCESLADLADAIGREEAAELRARAEAFKLGLESLWDERTGIYQNRRTDTGAFYTRLSPTNFYALFSDKVSPDRISRMMEEHFYNPGEFWGEFIMPTIARNDPAYPDQNYWRGRIWAPTNFLAYAAMRRHNLTKPCHDLAIRSVALFLKEWREFGHVHENYHGDTGLGCGIDFSDKFYHWGALLCLMGMMDEGLVEGPEANLQ